MLDATYPLVRRVLFSWDAEVAHERTLQIIGSAPRLWASAARAVVPAAPPTLARTGFGGLRFASPIGLAAGLDKDGVGVPFWGSLGFGFIEVGTVTAHAQPGNDRPRLFRLPDDRALINRMGFNNHGSSELANRLRGLRDAGHWPATPVGVNIGKSKITAIEDAVDDYVTSTRRLAGLCDWFTVNVSSPNTPGLRSLQDRDTLARLLPAVIEAANGTPVLVKLAPDLEDDAIVDAVELGRQVGLAGIIATNTTLRRDGLTTATAEAGGMSGRPLWPIARRKIQVCLDAAGGKLPVVGVGGLETAEQVAELLDAGCCAVQLYTAFVYEGPGLPARLNRALAKAR
jgi:dihydroorotate dehydrogenase